MQADLPTDLNGWITLAVTVGALIIQGGIIVWRMSKATASQRHSFQEQGKRIGGLESAARASEVSVDDLRRKHQQQEFQLNDLQRQSGEVRARFDEVLRSNAAEQESRHKYEIENAARLARIEERLSLFIELYSNAHRE